MWDAPAELGRRAWRRPGVRFGVLALADAMAWAFALVVSLFLRFDLTFTSIDWSGFEVVLMLGLVLQFTLGVSLGLYHGRFKLGSFEELWGLVVMTLVTALVVFVLNIGPLDREVPASVPLTAGLLTLIVAAGMRYGWRWIAERALLPAGGATRLVIFGSGETGTQIARLLLRNPQSTYLPVAFLDDDPSKRRFRSVGIPVRGTAADLVAVAHSTGATALLLAAPTAPTSVVRALAREARACGLSVRALPSVDELIEHQLSLSDIRPLIDAELMGREPVITDFAAVRAAIAGRRVLVTGAGGSIGAEICRQVAELGPAELVMLDRDESALHAVQLSIHGRALLDTPNLVVADIRDRERVYELFTEWRPEIVFHAAALKHLPLLEMYPEEAIKTNISGTVHVLEAARAAGVTRFVNISTDKAAQPISVLGYTKRIGERVTSWFAAKTEHSYVSVRFGNVLGSRGSILATFQHQIAEGGPVTVTHPDVTRYFMTVGEAVQLVLQASTIGRAGEVLVLDMGAPVRIRDLAEGLIGEERGDVEILYTGLRQGEKLHEDLFGLGERDERPAHPLIAQTDVLPLDPIAVGSLVVARPTGELVEALAILSASDIEVPVLSASVDEVGVMVVGADGIIQACSDLAATIITGSPERLQGSLAPFFRLDLRRADGSPLPAQDSTYARVLGSGRAVEDRLIGLCHGRGMPVIWIRVSSRPIRANGSDELTAILLLLRLTDWDPDPTRPEVTEELART